MFKKLASSLVLSLLLLVPAALAQTETEVVFPEPDGYVNDFAEILDTETEAELETKLREFEGRTSTEIAVVTVTDLAELNIERYTYELGTAWGVGKQGSDNGVVFLVAPEQRQTRIEVGYGLEGAITDLTAYGILSETVLPYFSAGNFPDGILAGVDNIIRASEDEEFANQLAGTNANPIPLIGSTIMIVLFFVFGWFMSLLARSKSWWAGGIFGSIAGVIITIVNSSLWYFIIILAAVGLLLDFLVSKNHQRAGKTSWWAGGGSWSGGSSSSSSFGGGSFGGGGSSGSW